MGCCSQEKFRPVWEVAMRGVLSAALFVIVGHVPLWGQHGTAEAGYYPMGFVGDTWTGVVTAVNDDTREITLTYTKSNRTQTFVGVLVEGYKVKLRDGSVRELKVSQIPIGSRIKVYYMPRQRKSEGKKVRYYGIFRIEFLFEGEN